MASAQQDCLVAQGPAWEQRGLSTTEAQAAVSPNFRTNTSVQIPPAKALYNQPPKHLMCIHIGFLAQVPVYVQGEKEDALLSAAAQLGKILQQLMSPVVTTSDIFIR